MNNLGAPSIVAIVDDDEAIRIALRRLVRTIGYDAKTFESGEALLAVFNDALPACVLTDIQMPGMNGLDLANELRRQRPDLPIAVMTAYPSLAGRDAARSSPPLAYMEKPLDDHLLEAWLKKEIGEPPAG